MNLVKSAAVRVLGVALGLGVSFLTTPRPAHAGVEACNSLRLEDVGGCELRGSVDCEVGCDDIGIYKKACATKLQTVCHNDCTFDADPACTDQCTGVCQETCDRGENVVCIHNCFGECTDSCEINCLSAVDPDQCNATCEANCDAECDIKCKPLVDGDCYKHCLECCGGTCTADANLSCQQSCQEEQFEECEYEFRLDCNASCSAEGAIFCDGEYVLSGKQVPDCVADLVSRGLADIDVEAAADIRATDGGVEVDGVGSVSVPDPGCTMRPRTAPARALWTSLGLVMAGFTTRRKRRRA